MQFVVGCVSGGPLHTCLERGALRGGNPHGPGQDFHFLQRGDLIHVLTSFTPPTVAAFWWDFGASLGVSPKTTQ